MLLENRIRLSQCESKITLGMQSFYDVGKALREIKELELFKEDGYQTFEEYCTIKWDFGKQYAYRLIASANVMQDLQPSPIGEKVPRTESQVRSLTKIDSPQLRQQAWNEACEETPNVTASVVQSKVLKYVPQNEESSVMDRRVVTYLNHGQLTKWDSLLRGAKEADYLRRVITYHLKHPECID